MLTRTALTRITLITAAAAALAVPLATALPAAASVGPRMFANCATSASGGCVGYRVSSAQFQRITASVFLRNPTQYQGITDGIGWDEILQAGTQWSQIVGISNTTTSPSVWSPSYLILRNGTRVSGADSTAMWCPVPGQPCSPASQGGGFPTGQTVTITSTYNRAEGTVNVSATDLAGHLYRAFFFVGTGLSFNQGRVEAGYGAFTPPNTMTRLLRFTAAGVTTYNGVSHSLASFFARNKIIATSNGMSGGRVEATPSDLENSGTAFSVDFQP